MTTLSSGAIRSRARRCCAKAGFIRNPNLPNASKPNSHCGGRCGLRLPAIRCFARPDGSFVCILIDRFIFLLSLSFFVFFIPPDLKAFDNLRL
jgi:hypothetical protein